MCQTVKSHICTFACCLENDLSLAVLMKILTSLYDWILLLTFISNVWFTFFLLSTKFTFYYLKLLIVICYCFHSLLWTLSIKLLTSYSYLRIFKQHFTWLLTTTLKSTNTSKLFLHHHQPKQQQQQFLSHFLTYFG